MPRTPLSRYQAGVETGDFQHDPEQEAAVRRLDRLYHELLAYDEAVQAYRKGLRRWFGASPKAPQGVYFWGGVGRGKTFIMDTFYDCLPLEAKHRAHFHRFMQFVHRRLTDLKGEKNPLDLIATEMAQQHRILCLDEFFVTDIGDAMILGNLLEGLFREGVVLVTTSNIVPDGLYENGLQRERFLPAIRLLNTHTDVINLDHGVDYRLRTLEQATLYYSPADEMSETRLREQFDRIAPDLEECQVSGTMEVLGRQIAYVRECEDIVWFRFQDICGGPRSANDYIEIARLYHAVVISGVPQFDADDDDIARRFINLVDEFYDRRVKLLVSAAAPITELYVAGQRRFEFERTESRLLEMQSHDYLAAQHRA
ncbi:cell division protein ZapE [Natronospirillum operosum]|uniref:Cell division protein ZapE n=1 Tax=Natronospirillum operosum TaxID=2759953 RepID=A0A4Z0W298_9GAMM|nr:cell division protein ZapE [Natronospirillum operosum]TGG90799.1 cell division protein ZapE [Natronospirillum operosum]